jgi:hypothetical protein
MPVATGLCPVQRDARRGHWADKIDNPSNSRFSKLALRYAAEFRSAHAFVLFG